VAEDLADLFHTAVPSTTVVSLVLEPDAHDVDLNLHVFNLIGCAMVASSNSAELGAAERIENLMKREFIFAFVVTLR